jgi:hypothetical protein
MKQQRVRSHRGYGDLQASFVLFAPFGAITFLVVAWLIHTVMQPAYPTLLFHSLSKRGCKGRCPLGSLLYPGSTGANVLSAVSMQRVLSLAWTGWYILRLGHR